MSTNKAMLPRLISGGFHFKFAPSLYPPQYKSKNKYVKKHHLLILQENFAILIVTSLCNGLCTGVF